MKSLVSVRKPIVMKMWEQYPKTWKLLIDLGIFLKYKTLNINKIPNKIVLPSENILYVNSDENRGRALLIKGGVTQKRLRTFWSNAVKYYNPDVIIDVGVNYGECIFSTTYPSHTKVYGIEANSKLFQYIEKSRAAHPNKSQITMIHALASDSDGDRKWFFIDKHWSGTSSASYKPSHHMIEKTPVETITIDSLFKEDITPKNLLFKIDVEGYEAFVLKGMRQLIEKSHTALGFLEFNSEYIERSGIQADAFFADLKKYFTIYFYKDDVTIVNAAQKSYKEIQAIFGSLHFHTDFIVAKGDKIMDSLKLIDE
ncbi:FkbM family methyltransferase [Bacillus pakistanensis]|uniref:FkbM family methyltransferase n=1 Tax=Rossellomorea pakistanensis TaxID=992288 RepID=A0ABS2N868_9BACI|nr:FkbM family methyltransferase [Bacillus pakistanensis]MBM7584023.1 FkbM family methyltransferase [Bacillus pakistanensis]